MQDLDQLASELVVAAARVVRAGRRAVSQPTGVRVLSILDELGEQSITQLADADRSSQPAMSGTVSTLIDNGWVTKHTDPADARRSVIALTDDGRSTLADFRRELGRALADRLRTQDTYDTADVEHAVAVLRTVLDIDPHSPQKGTL
ncbi:MAG TPA: MarR family transcriptional regulator [Marmoricola sp.]